MKTFTNCAEKKAKQFLNLLQGYTKGIRMTAILILLLLGVSNAWAENHTGGYIYFLKPSTWTESKVMMFIGHDSYTSVYEMTKVSNTDNLYRYTMPSWSGATYVAFANDSYVWGTGNWGPSNRTNAKHYTNVYNNYRFDSGSYYVIVPASTSNNAGITINYTGTTASSVNRTTKAISSNAAAGTVSVSGYYMSNATTASARSAVSSTASNATASTTLAPASTATFKATANTGYEFVGWYDAASGGNQLSTSTTYTVKYDISFSEKTVYGRFRAKTYTVTLNASGGTGGTGSVTATYNVAMPLATMPTRNGYTFKGYYDATSGGTQYYKADGSSARTWNKAAASTLYAQWELATYTITYDNLKGTTHTNPATYTINSATITFTAPTSKPAGYTFANWSPASIATGSTGNKTVTANWTAATSTVELNQEEATEKGTASVTATYGSAMPAITKRPIRTGYTFGGYYTGKNGAGTQYYKADGTSATTWNLEGAQTLYAKWTPITYSVKFNGNGSTSGSMSNQSFTYDEVAKALTTNAFKKTGYTFAGWNTAANGSGTSYADKATVRNLTTTNNATINLYAQWTINQYTLTFLAGEGGEVTATVGGNPISSPAALNYNTQVMLTATPTGENAFAQWVNEKGVKVSTDNPYTFNLTTNTTIKAEFSVPTTVYLKPEDYWKSDNACFAIVASATGKSDKKIDMESADCENIYYKVDIPAGYTDFKYVRLDPNNKNTIWNETGKLYAENAKGKMYVTPRIYFKPNIHWKSDNARFAVYFWKSSNDSENTWRDLTSIGDDIYTCITPGESYDRAIFCRMDPAKSDNIWDNKWNQTNNLYIDHNSIDGKNLYTVTKADGNNMDGEIGEWHTHWETFAPTYTVTLDPFQYGTYGVIYDGKTYMSKKDESVIIDNVPLGAKIEVIDAKSTSPHYVANTRYETSVVLQPGHDVFPLQEILKDQVIEICGNTCFASNLVTKDAHRVYLHIPQSVLDNWNTNSTPNDNYVFVRDHLTNGKINNGEGALPQMTKDAYLSSLGKGEYWYCDIPAGYHTFRFERKKDNKEGTGCSNYTTTFSYGIPLTNFNCFTLNEAQNSSPYSGYWDVTPASTGDYRLLYVEQVVEKSEEDGDEWQTIVERTYTHTSDIIKKRTSAGVDTVSLHIYTRGSHPEVILQQFNTTTGEWDDIEAHMVNGPLEATPDKAMLPGRKNAGIGSSVDDFVYDDGIEVIKADEHDDGCGVWNFPVEQDGRTATLNLLEGHLKRYTGEYYIRTDNAEGGWEKYTLPGNYMTYSQYAKDHSGFSHYFCKWVEVDNKPNTKFVISNDYGVAISDTLAKDDYTDEHGTIAYDANIRWSWNIVDNKVARAYIQGTWDVKTSTRNRNLVVNYKSSSTAADATDLLDDSGDWIYQKDFTVKVGSHLNSLTAQYPVTTGPIQTFAENLDMLTGSSGNTKDYTVRVLYDFKINKTLVALVPNENQADIAIDVIIERVDQEPATQVQSGITRTVDQGATVYAVMSFTKDHIKGSAPKYAKQFYWISFPFDVRISEVFGFGEYGKHWIIQWYDGAERAKNGCWIDSPTYWRFQTDTTDYFLEAGKGYVLTLDLEEMDVFPNTTQVSLYFPSIQKFRSIDGLLINDLNTVTLAPYTCTIERDNRNKHDSHWHMLGVPSFANKDMTFKQDDVAYFYQYDSNDDTYDVTSSGTFDFQSMFSYMVQFAGTINWSEFSFAANGGQGLAAKKNTNDTQDKHILRLELQKNGTFADQTFVQMQSDGATNMYDMNLDLSKMLNSGNNIYSLIKESAGNMQVAGNVLPVGEAVIPVGVVISAAGEYTFAMPDGTDGIVAELIDYEANTTTNLLFNDYTVSLPKGTFENRFALSVRPDKTVTSMENITTPSDSEVRKFIIDGVLYMQKDGVLYDAQGRCVK